MTIYLFIKLILIRTKWKSLVIRCRNTGTEARNLSFCFMLLQKNNDGELTI